MMIQFTSRHSKKIALLLFAIFYAELAGSVYASARSYLLLRERNYFYSGMNSGNIKSVAKRINAPTDAFPGYSVAEKRSPVLAKQVANVDPEAELNPVDDDNAVYETGGPGQPEMSSFQSAGADNLVNLFTGDFSYNIPLLDLGGYPVNIFYTGGITMDQEASWVGLGWNLNPGTISRNMRGLPDDFNGENDHVVNVQSIKADKTIGVSMAKGGELFGKQYLSGGYNLGIFYNNRRGLGLEAGVNAEYSPQKMLSVKVCDEKALIDSMSSFSTVTAGVSGALKLNSQNGLTTNFGLGVYLGSDKKKYRYGLSTSIGYSSRAGLTDLSIAAERQKYSPAVDNWNCYVMTKSGSRKYLASTMSFARTSYTPSIRMPLRHDNYLLSLKLGSAKTGFFKNGTLSGYMQKMSIDALDTFQKKPAYGYMHHAKAEDNNDAIMDFNRMNDGVYTLKTPMIAIPAYTHDIFTINGEGTGGSFRGYHGNLGFVKDNVTRSRSGSYQLMTEIGGGKIFHGGISVGGSYTHSESGDWISGNMLRHNAKLEESNGTYQGFYFKNPGEKAIIPQEFYDAVGQDQLIRPFLVNTKTPSPQLASGYRIINEDKEMDGTLPVTPGLKRIARDKRAQAISYFTAEEASHIGLDKLIYSYTENEFQPGSCINDFYKVGFNRFSEDPALYRKRHHISQINVLESDGRRYVYGVPVYQTLQKEVTFSINGTESVNNLVSYDTDPSHPDNSVKNTKGRDAGYQREELSGYAHSYLLSGILSPDYMDVTGDGITEDDLGTAVKFNYTRVNRVKSESSQSSQGVNGWPSFKWRMPVQENTAIHSEGLKTDDRDDKAMYTYGEKELWYLHSIESKNMVACFYVSARTDGKQVRGENGGVNSSLYSQRKLDSIRVFTKAEYFKSGDGGRPVKTVHFQYSYKLTPSYPLNGQAGENSGKLTLESIWFTYNNHNKVKKNKYVFRYGAMPSSTIVNPSYNSALSDRWGNYKDVAGNPSDVPNRDFPYAEQDPELAAQYATAWNLTDILLPSGGVVSVQYEADDYAFVQDKRASVMTKIAGFGNSAGATPVNTIYNYDRTMSQDPRLADHRFIFFDLPEPLETKEQIATLYLQDFKQLLMKLWIRMPGGNLGVAPAYEPVIIYGAIKDYDFQYDASLPGNRNKSRFYVELEPTEDNGSPIVQTAFQFLREHLPHRAFPGYQVNGDGALKEVARAVWGLFDALVQGALGFERNMKISKQCRLVDMELSGARLNHPEYRKLGGGNRVKKVVIGDNWSKLLKRTSDASKLDSWYGQEYDYTTVEEVNGEIKVISSGVATYEPGIGNEENPFREVMQFSTTQPLGPTSIDNIELPFGEMFFPASMVGYSRVTVRSIHNKTNKRLKAGVGLQQTNFYTSREFPVIMDHTSFDQESRSHHKPGFINKILEFRLRQYSTLTQGFRVILNDMNGKMRSQASFPENDYKNPVNYTAYHYRLKAKGDGKHRLDNVVPVIKGPDGIISNQLIGKDVEIVNDFREHLAISQSGQLPINGDLFKLGAIPMLIPTFFRLVFQNENRYRSAATLKIVNEYGILDSVVNIDKGSVVGTRNLVYDGETGDVLLTRTTNEFRDAVYQFNFPARWVESGLESAYKNLDMVYSNVLFRNGFIENPVEGMMDNFESGDEVYVLESDDEGPMESDACIIAGYPLRLKAGEEPLVWAVDLRKDDRNPDEKFIFIDRYGVPLNALNAKIRVVRSGKRNVLAASVGSFTSLENPIKKVGDIDRIVVDNNTGVLAAGAMEFREKWRTNDQFYAVDTVMVTVKQTPLYNTSLYPETVYSGVRKLKSESRELKFYGSIVDKTFEIVKKRKRDKRGLFNLDTDKFNYDQQSWMRFNLPSFLQGVTVKNASLYLPGHFTKHLPAIKSDNDIDIGHHPLNLPHKSYDNSDHPMAMTMKISRMLNTWGSTNSDWLNRFDDTWANDLLNDHVTYTPSYTPSKMQFAGNYTVNIDRIAQSMINNYSNSAQAPGIKLSFLYNSFRIDDHKGNSPWRYCFHTFDRKCSDCLYDGVRINLQYYKCQESDPVVYSGIKSDAPTVPPTGYVYCSTETVNKICLSTFDKKQMNPYIQGVLGNWRAYRSYVFYGERKESDANSATNIRKDGQLKEFEFYWAFGDEKLTKTDNAKWVWNSEITQYNRKGAELENHDPLDRYNSGIYGYQESLPIAVTSNSRLRLSAFDGFEDYAYQDDPCQPFCEPTRRHFDFGISSTMLTNAEAHTGRYSLPVAASTTFTADIAVGADDRVSVPDQRIKILQTEVEVTTVNPDGLGLRGEYFSNLNFTGTPVVREDPIPVINIQRGNIWGGLPDYFNVISNLPPGVPAQNISVRWTGSIQVTQTGFYEFDANADEEVWVKIKDRGNIWQQALYAKYNIPNHTILPVELEAGELHEIEIEYKQKGVPGFLNLMWRKPDITGTIPPAAELLTVPFRHFYTPGSEGRAEGTVITETMICEKPDTIQVINHKFIDSFALIPGQKMLASVWVKKGGEDCKCTSYGNLNLVVKDGAGEAIGTFLPKEGVIEGWQQMEAIFIVPEEGEKITLSFTALDKALYFDDLRLHPFNANMKSFVYDAVNLRLVADLDENNFASFYEYDDEGTLIRVKKETRAGVKTITETRSAIQKEVTNF